MQSYISTGGTASAVPHLSLSTQVDQSFMEGTQFSSSFAPGQTHLSPSSPAASQGLSSSLAGPLSSHPVTPVGGPSPSANNIPDSYNWSRKAAAREMTQSRTNLSSYQNGGLKAHDDPDDANNFDPALPSYQPFRDTSRRPSLVERFMPRLRSSSFMRNRSRSTLGRFNDSSTSLSQQTGKADQHHDENSPQFVDDAGRSTKRPASPSVSRPQSRGAASTFPRMLRKKSLELLGTGRRRSTMWGEGGTGTTASAYTEELEREHLREQELREEQGKKQKVAMIRAELDKKPTPKLPELPSIGSVTGGSSLVDQDLFSSIGR